MEIQHLTYASLPSTALQHLVLHCIPSHKALRLTRVCKHWYTAIHSKEYWQKLAEEISYCLLIPPKHIIPQTPCDLSTFAFQIRSSAQKKFRAIQDVLLRVFPDITQSCKNVLDPSFFSPYSEYLYNAQISFKHTQNTTTFENIAKAIARLLDEKRFYPKIFYLFLNHIQNYSWKEDLPSIETFFDTLLGRGYIQSLAKCDTKIEEEMILDLVSFTKSSSYEIVSLVTLVVSINYLHYFTTNDFSIYKKNNNVLNSFIAFLQELTKNKELLHELINKYNAMYTIKNPGQTIVFENLLQTIQTIISEASKQALQYEAMFTTESLDQAITL